MAKTTKNTQKIVTLKVNGKVVRDRRKALALCDYFDRAVAAIKVREATK